MNRTDAAEIAFINPYSDPANPLPDFDTQADLVALRGLNAAGGTSANPLAADAGVIANYNVAVALVTATVGTNNLYTAQNIGPLAIQLATLAVAFNPVFAPGNSQFNELRNMLYVRMNNNIGVFGVA